MTLSKFKFGMVSEGRFLADERLQIRNFTARQTLVVFLLRPNPSGEECMFAAVSWVVSLNSFIEISVKGGG